MVGWAESGKCDSVANVPDAPHASNAVTPNSATAVDGLVLRRAGGVTAVVGLVITAIGFFVDGSKGLIAGLMGTVIVLVFFSIGQGVLGWVLRNNPQMALMVALGIYLVKIGALFVLIVLLQDATFFNFKIFAMCVVGCTIAWTTAEIYVFGKSKVLYVEPEGMK